MNTQFRQSIQFPLPEAAVSVRFKTLAVTKGIAECFPALPKIYSGPLQRMLTPQDRVFTHSSDSSNYFYGNKLVTNVSVRFFLLVFVARYFWG